MPPTASVIIPCYNASEFLDTSIRSVREQTLEDLELLVVDDGSTDGSLEIARAHAGEDSRVRVLCPGRLGQYAVRNLGVSRADGRWIQFLDADDWLHRDKLRFQIQWAEDQVEGSGEVVLYGDYRVVKDAGDGAEPAPLADVDVEHADERALLRSMLHWQFRPDAPLWVPACLFAAAVFRRRRFETDLTGLADTLFLVDLLREHVPFVYTPIQGVAYRRHGGNITADGTYSRRAYIDYLVALAERDPALVRETRNIPRLLDTALRLDEPHEFRRLVRVLRATGVPEASRSDPEERARLQLLRTLGGEAGYTVSRAWRRVRSKLGRIREAASSAGEGSLTGTVSKPS